jgi:hypothetical protein
VSTLLAGFALPAHRLAPNRTTGAANPSSRDLCAHHDQRLSLQRRKRRRKRVLRGSIATLKEKARCCSGAGLRNCEATGSRRTLYYRTQQLLYPVTELAKTLVFPDPNAFANFARDACRRMRATTST